MKKQYFRRVIAHLLCLVLVVLFFPFIKPQAVANTFTTDSVPINPYANQTCKNFYQYLINVGRGDAVLSGAFSQKYDEVSASQDYFKYIQEYYGVTPSIFETIGDPNTEIVYNESVKRYKKHGAIPLFTVQHMGGGCTTNMNVAKGILNLDSTNPDRDMEKYNEYREQLKSVADAFERLEKDGVEVYMARIWGEHNRMPFFGHVGNIDEKNKCQETMKKVWAQMCDYFFNERKLTGLLVIYAPMGFGYNSEGWYPGDEYVDINGPTIYSANGKGNIFTEDVLDYEWMRKCSRPFAVSEGSAREAMASAQSNPGDFKLYLESFLYKYPETCFITLWNTDYYALMPSKGIDSFGNYNGDYFIYNEKVINAEELPDFSKGVTKSTGNATLYSKKDLKGDVFYLQEGEYNAATLKSKGVTLKNIKSANILFSKGLILYEEDNFKGESYLVTGKCKEVNKFIEKAKSLKVVSLKNLSYYKNIYANNNDSAVVKLNDGRFNRVITNALSDNTLEITIELDGEYAVSQMAVDTAGFYESNDYNVRDFEIQVSTDNTTYTPVYKMVGNPYAAVNASFKPVKASYVKFKVLTPNSSKSEYDRDKVSLTEVTVYGTEVGTLVLDEVTEPVIESPENKDDYYSGYVDDIIGSENSENIENLDNTNNSDNTDKTTDTANKPSKIVIPEFYNYIWIIFCAVVLLIPTVLWVITFVKGKRNKS